MTTENQTTESKPETVAVATSDWLAHLPPGTPDDVVSVFRDFFEDMDHKNILVGTDSVTLTNRDCSVEVRRVAWGGAIGLASKLWRHGPLLFPANNQGVARAAQNTDHDPAR